MVYYDLALPEVWTCDPSPRWVLQRQRENMLCSVCERILPGWFPTPIDVVYSRPVQPYHILETSQTGIALIDRRLLDRLQPYLPSVAIGRALNKNNQEIETHRTVYPESIIQRRHYPPRKIVPCIECNIIRAYPASTEPSYLMSYQVADKPCVMDRIGAIYVSEDVAQRIDISDLKPLYFHAVGVKDRPLDGLRYPDDPPWVEGRDATIPWDSSTE